MQFVCSTTIRSRQTKSDVTIYVVYFIPFNRWVLNAQVPVNTTVIICFAKLWYIEYPPIDISMMPSKVYMEQVHVKLRKLLYGLLQR